MGTVIMKRLLLASFLAALAVFVWGFVFWGLSPMSAAVMQSADDDQAAQAALRETFPKSGVYFVPSPAGDPAAVDALHRAGPVAMVHIQMDGRPAMDPGIFVWGFVHGWLVCLILGWLLLRAGPALPAYRSRVLFIAAAGFAAALFIDYGDTIWWYSDRSWQLLNLTYNTVAWLVAGVVLAAILKPDSASDPGMRGGQ
jgi:hypothetical protein